MNKIIKTGSITLLTLVGLVFFSGCEAAQENSARRVEINVANSDFKVYCDKDTNIEYLVYRGYRTGGLTLRVNSDGTPKSCKKN